MSGAPRSGPAACARACGAHAAPDLGRREPGTGLGVQAEAGCRGPWAGALSPRPLTRHLCRRSCPGFRPLPAPAQPCLAALLRKGPAPPRAPRTFVLTAAEASAHGAAGPPAGHAAGHSGRSLAV